jgi:hypothetical protein
VRTARGSAAAATAGPARSRPRDSADQSGDERVGKPRCAAIDQTFGPVRGVLSLIGSLIAAHIRVSAASVGAIICGSPTSYHSPVCDTP